MSTAADQFRINLNQNLWGLIVSFGALGAAEYFELRALFWFSIVASVITLVSITVTTLAYTIQYWKNKQAI